MTKGRLDEGRLGPGRGAGIGLTDGGCTDTGGRMGPMKGGAWIGGADEEVTAGMDVVGAAGGGTNGVEVGWEVTAGMGVACGIVVNE